MNIKLILILYNRYLLENCAKKQIRVKKYIVSMVTMKIDSITK